MLVSRELFSQSNANDTKYNQCDKVDALAHTNNVTKLSPVYYFVQRVLFLHSLAFSLTLFLSVAFNA